MLATPHPERLRSVGCPMSNACCDFYFLLHLYTVSRKHQALDAIVYYKISNDYLTESTRFQKLRNPEIEYLWKAQRKIKFEQVSMFSSKCR